MKHIYKLMLGGATIALAASAVAMPSSDMQKKFIKKVGPEFRLQILESKAAMTPKKGSHKKMWMTDSQCAMLMGKTAMLNQTMKKQMLGPNFYLTKFKWQLKKEPGGLVIAKTTNNGIMTDAKGKVLVTKKGYTRAVSYAGSDTFYGAFNDGFCKGFYKATSIMPPKKAMHPDMMKHQ